MTSQQCCCRVRIIHTIRSFGVESVSSGEEEARLVSLQPRTIFHCSCYLRRNLPLIRLTLS